MLKLLKIINDKRKRKVENYNRVDKVFAKAMYKIYKEEEDAINLELKQNKSEHDFQKEELLANLRLHKKELQDQGKLKTQTRFEWLKDIIFAGIDETLVFGFKQVVYGVAVCLIILVPLGVFFSIDQKNVIKENIAINQPMAENTVENIKIPAPIEFPITKPFSETISKSNNVDSSIENKNIIDNQTVTKNNTGKLDKLNNKKNNTRYINKKHIDNISSIDNTRSVDNVIRDNNDYNKTVKKVYIDYFGNKEEEVLLQKLVIEKIQQTSLVIVKENEIVNKRPDLTVEKDGEVIVISDSIGRILLRKSLNEMNLKSLDEVANFIIKEILKTAN